MKNKIIDIDAEFEGVEFDETLINRSQSAYAKRGNKQFGATMSKVAQTRNQDPAYRQNLKEGCINRDNTYQAKSNACEETRRKISESLKGKSKSQDHIDKVAAKTRERAKPVIVPWGVYRSGKLAGDAYNRINNVSNGKNRVSANIKKGTVGYRFISLEEYIMLTSSED